MNFIIKSKPFTARFKNKSSALLDKDCLSSSALRRHMHIYQFTRRNTEPAHFSRNTRGQVRPVPKSKSKLLRIVVADARYPSCGPTNSVKALNDDHTIESNISFCKVTMQHYKSTYLLTYLNSSFCNTVNSST